MLHVAVDIQLYYGKWDKLVNATFCKNSIYRSSYNCLSCICRHKV